MRMLNERMIEQNILTLQEYTAMHGKPQTNHSQMVLLQRLLTRPMGTVNRNNSCFSRLILQCATVALIMIADIVTFKIIDSVTNIREATFVRAEQSQRCGVDNAKIRIRGSIAVNPVMSDWIPSYRESCRTSNTSFDMDYSHPVDEKYAITPGFGISAVCDGEADIGVMERAIDTNIDNVKRVEGLDTQVERYICTKGIEPLKEMIQVPIAMDAMVVFVGKESRAWRDCMKFKKEGLNRDELRWMFSSTVTSFKPPYNRNMNRQIRRWNQLVRAIPCQRKKKNNIRIVIPNNDVTDKNRWFEQLVFNESLSEITESFRSSVGVYDDKSDALSDAVIQQPWGVGFCSYSYYKKNMDTIQALAINGVLPTDESIRDGRYDFFSRTLYANYWTQPLYKQETACFSRYTFTEKTAKVISDAGEFVPLPSNLYDKILERLPSCDISTVDQSNRVSIASLLSPILTPILSLPILSSPISTVTDDLLRNIQNILPPVNGSSIVIGILDPIVAPVVAVGKLFAYNLTGLNVVLQCLLPRGCVFDGSSLNGKGMFFGESGILTLEGITFINSGSETFESGGSVISMRENSNVTVVNCIFFNNSAEYGGALHVDDSNLSFRKASTTAELSRQQDRRNFRQYVRQLLQLGNTSFTEHIVFQKIRQLLPQSIFDNEDYSAYFLQNSAWRGAALDVVEGSLTLDSVIFEKNSAIRYGGSICVFCMTNTIIKNSIFKDNFSQVYGGAVHVQFPDALLQLENVAFENNRAGLDGAAIHIESSAVVNMTNCSFFNNTSYLPMPSGTYSTDDSNVTGTATNGWSAVSSKNATFSLTNVWFAKNKRAVENATANIFVHGGVGSCSAVTLCDGLGISDPGVSNTNCQGSNVIIGSSGVGLCPS